MNIDSTRLVELVNNRQRNLGVCRPDIEARVYTDSVQGMRRAVARTQEKELALDVVKQQPTLAATITQELNGTFKQNGLETSAVRLLGIYRLLADP